MEIVFVTYRQEATATHFHLFSKYRCRSLDLEASYGWKWRDSSLNFLELLTLRFAFIPISTVNDLSIRIQYATSIYIDTAVTYPEMVQKITSEGSTQFGCETRNDLQPANFTR